MLVAWMYFLEIIWIIWGIAQLEIFLTDAAVPYFGIVSWSAGGIWQSSYFSMTEHILMFCIYLSKFKSVVLGKLFSWLKADTDIANSDVCIISSPHNWRAEKLEQMKGETPDLLFFFLLLSSFNYINSLSNKQVTIELINSFLLLHIFLLVFHPTLACGIWGIHWF